MPCLLGRPRRLVPGIARSIAVQVTVFSGDVQTNEDGHCIIQYNIVDRERCNMRRISLFRMWSSLNTPRIPRSILTSVVAIFLLLFTVIAQHSLTCLRQSRYDYGLVYFKIFYHDSSLIWVSVPVMSIVARSSAYSSSHGSSDRISWDLLHIHIIWSWLRRMLPHWLSVVLSDSWLDRSSTNDFDDVMMASWWNWCCFFPLSST